MWNVPKIILFSVYSGTYSIIIIIRKCSWEGYLFCISKNAAAIVHYSSIIWIQKTKMHLSIMLWTLLFWFVLCVKTEIANDINKYVCNPYFSSQKIKAILQPYSSKFLSSYLSFVAVWNHLNLFVLLITLHCCTRILASWHF